MAGWPGTCCCAGAGTAASPDGAWTVEPGDGVFAGYRVDEQFAGDVVDKTATGRTPAVDGSITIAGNRIKAATFTVDLTRLVSDQDRRDAALRTRGLETERYPEASFELTAPVSLPAALSRGETVEVAATGDLTLHSRTRAVEVALEGRWDGATIAVAGDAPITFADFGIVPIDIGGFVATDDHGTFDVQLVLVPA